MCNAYVCHVRGVRHRYLASGSGRSFILSCDGAHAYIMRATFDLDPAHLFRNIILCFTHFHMSEEQQQSLKEHSHDVIKSPDTVPPGPHNQAWMPRDYAVRSFFEYLVRVLTASGCSRFTLHLKYLSSGLHWQASQLTVNHSVWATMHNTVCQLQL
jgi:hypothetical protein